MHASAALAAAIVAAAHVLSVSQACKLTIAGTEHQFDAPRLLQPGTCAHSENARRWCRPSGPCRNARVTQPMHRQHHTVSVSLTGSYQESLFAPCHLLGQQADADNSTVWQPVATATACHTHANTSKQLNPVRSSRATAAAAVAGATTIHLLHSSKGGPLLKTGRIMHAHNSPPLKHDANAQAHTQARFARPGCFCCCRCALSCLPLLPAPAAWPLRLPPRLPAKPAATARQ